jgi:ribosomal protein S18 acetylase RimI-like enzyme
MTAVRLLHESETPACKRILWEVLHRRPRTRVSQAILKGLCWGGFRGTNLMGIALCTILPENTLFVNHLAVSAIFRNSGVGSAIVSHLFQLEFRAVSLNVWADNVRAINFYEKHGFKYLSNGAEAGRDYWVMERPRLTP